MGRNSGNKHDLVKFLAFLGIAISAILYVVTGICNVCGASLGMIGSILNLVAALALLLAVIFPAWDWIKGKKKLWRILFFICIIVYIVGCVLGVVVIG